MPKSEARRKKPEGPRKRRASCQPPAAVIHPDKRDEDPRTTTMAERLELADHALPRSVTPHDDWTPLVLALPDAAR